MMMMMKEEEKGRGGAIAGLASGKVERLIDILIYGFGFGFACLKEHVYIYIYIYVLRPYWQRHQSLHPRSLPTEFFFKTAIEK